MRARIAGFTLVEMALVLGLVGLLAFLFLPMGRVMQEQAKIKETRAKLDAIEAAMVRYVMLNERLPCPADGQLPDSDPNAGQESRIPAEWTGCNSVARTRPVVPWRALGLTADDVVDAWGMRITYRPWMTPTALTPPTRILSLTADDIACAPGASVTGKPLRARRAKVTGTDNNVWEVLLTDTSCQVAPPNNNPGHRVLTKVTGGSSLANPDTSTNGKTGAAYVLISHGPNQCGGYTRSGIYQTQCAGTPASLDEQRNFNNQPSQGNGTGQGYVDRPYDESPSDHFDDIVRWRTIMQVAAEAKKVN
ncbi:MAG: type II secretion system protein [Tepidimonas ignava]|uniref:type II secretion system protein n=1 Tax=Tepidimonas ignava TaxID=114249 RepID=UPI00391A33C7